MKFAVKEPTSLLEFLQKALGTESKTKVRDWLRHGSVVVDGKMQKRGDVSLAVGQTVEVSRQTPRQASALAPSVAPPFPMLYEDDHLVGMEKPPGLLSIGTDREKTKTFYKAVSWYVKEASDDQEMIFIVHRLDREVSGVMIFAKSEEVKDALQRDWRETEKVYLALVEGHPQEPAGTIRGWLRESGAFRSYSCPEGTPDAQLAITHYRTLKTYARNSLLEVRIETGRKHQIRVHLADMGCPIVGDKKYGAQGSPIHRLGLHAFSLAFTHPVTGERIQLEAPAPAVFQQFGKHNASQAKS